MEKKLKILVLEDMPEDAELLQRVLRKSDLNTEIIVVDNKTSFIKSLSEFSPDIILSDHSLPTLNSVEALKITEEIKRDIPFILVTASVSEEFAVNMLKEGADDYILKSNLTRLPSSIEHVIKRYNGHKEQEKAKRELADAHERLMFHLENSPLGYIEWDNTIHVKSMSKRAEDIFGYTQAEFMENHRTGFTLIHEDDLAESHRVGQELIDGSVKSNIAQHRCYTKEGKMIWCEWQNSAIKDNDGNVTTIMSLVQDITERKKSERETLRLVENLQLKNKDLRQFSYMVSHNLRTPIAKILGLSQLFDSKSINTELNKKLMDNIVSETINLDNVVKDINTVVTVRDSGNLQKEHVLFKTDVDLVALVLENEIAQSKAKITTDFSAAEGINTVKSYLYSMIYNLLSNAVKYRRADEPLAIDIKTSLEKDFICFSIKDNGSGIELDKYADKLFGLYKRFHGEEIPGKGIGLNLVKAQAESLGGRVEVESKINSGSTFKIFLPN